MPSAAVEDGVMDGEVISMDAEKSRKFFSDMKEHPFLAIVVYGDGVRVFTKDIDASHIADIHSALDEALAERMQDGSTPS